MEAVRGCRAGMLQSISIRRILFQHPRCVVLKKFKFLIDTCFTVPRVMFPLLQFVPAWVALESQFWRWFSVSGCLSFHSVAWLSQLEIMFELRTLGPLEQWHWWETSIAKSTNSRKITESEGTVRSVNFLQVDSATFNVWRGQGGASRVTYIFSPCAGKWLQIKANDLAKLPIIYINRHETRDGEYNG